MSPKKTNARLEGIAAIMSNADTCGVIVDKNGKILASTPRFSEISGNKKTFRNLQEIFRDLPDVSSLKPNGDIRLVLNNSGKEITAKAVSTFQEDGNLAIIFRAPQNERILEERLELFHSAFEHSTDAITITKVDGTIIDVNDAFTKIFGYTREEVIGKTTALVKSKHSTRDFYNQMWESLDKHDQWKGEIINCRKDGMEIPVWLTITPIYLDGKKIGYMGIESDISERKNLEQQLIQTEKLATIGQLAAGIAHEIGTPLNIISGNAEYMLLDMKESEKGCQELLTIISQTKRMTQLMRQLLDFARPNILSLEPVNVNAVIKGVLDFVRLQFKMNDIEVKTNLEENLPKVYGDPALLYQVFLNTIVNAFQAMTRGGELRIHTSAENDGVNKGKIIVRIKDTGEGIQPENIERVFTPFFTTKEPGKGTGLGLAVTRRIVQEHNGTIKIDSEVGKGTAVVIMFNAFEPQKKSESKRKS
ncbi:MAG: PAS domain S-box protein [Bacteroidetes bacterium]|nr:PAS domain S-box protein [Bacteroidota bacterium]MCL5738187.1 PAS domain S-box protein [Bacteroidota bacterium]